MKIGIMSMQRIPNNGSFLQSYSLMRNLQNLGHEVVFVDYEPGPVLIEDIPADSSRWRRFFRKCKKHFLPPRKRNQIWQRESESFHQWEREYPSNMLSQLALDEQRKLQEEVDLLVIGSDEVFNCLQKNPAVGYSKQLFGADSHAGKVISYAASFGNTSLAGLQKYGIDEEVGQLLDKMDAISVRDMNSVSIVRELTGRVPAYHIDPVFLYDYEAEMPKEIPESGYIVVYAYMARINQREAREILRFAKKHHKKIICLAGAQEFFGGFIKTTPFESLAYVKHADYVITDTFHGTVFSIKYNKPFATLVRVGEEQTYGNSNKLLDLLHRFDMENHIVRELSQLEEVLLQPQDYHAVNQRIAEEREMSLQYLRAWSEEK